MSTDIRLVPPQPNWKQEFEQTRSMLLWATEGWISQAEHIGGTRLQTGIAQPIVDIIAGMSDMRGLNDAAAMVEGLNYRRVEAPGWCDCEHVARLVKPRVGSLTHSVLIVRLGGKIWKRVNAVQQWLESHLVDAERLQNLKLDSANRTPCEYEQLKAAFFQDIERNAED